MSDTEFRIDLNDKWKVTLIPEPPQWVLSLRHGNAWEGRAYCQSKQALLTAVEEKVKRAASYYKSGKNYAVDPLAEAQLADLPDRAKDLLPALFGMVRGAEL